MLTYRVLRIGGLVLMIAAVFSLVGTLISPNSPDPRQQIASTLFLPSEWLSVLGGILALIAFPAIYARIVRRSGAVGLAGFACMMTVSATLGFFAPVLNLVIFPWLVEQPLSAAAMEQGPPALGTFFMVAGLIALVGAVLFGIATIRSGLYARWIGYLLILAGVANLVISLTPVPPGIIQNLGAFCFYVALGGYGYELWTRSVDVSLAAASDESERPESRAA
jgi:hypothetical protein